MRGQIRGYSKLRPEHHTQSGSGTHHSASSWLQVPKETHHRCSGGQGGCPRQAEGGQLCFLLLLHWCLDLGSAATEDGQAGSAGIPAPGDPIQHGDLVLHPMSVCVWRGHYLWVGSMCLLVSVLYPRCVYSACVSMGNMVCVCSVYGCVCL